MPTNISCMELYPIMRDNFIAIVVIDSVFVTT